jgi:hypothetical protein
MSMVSRKSSSPLMITFHQLIILAFFFALRSCEYLCVDNSHWKANTKSKARRTLPLQLSSFVFWKDHRILPHNSPVLHLADAVTIIFLFQKTNVRNEQVTQTRTGHKLYCPVVAAASIVRRLLLYKQHSACKSDNPFVYEFLTSKGKAGILKSKIARQLLREFINLRDYSDLGLDAALCGLHSIRSSAAMAMYLNGVPVYTIMLLGRWSSDAFLRYIRKQVEQFGHDVAKLMIQNPRFHNTEIAGPEDPRNHNSLSTAANMGMGRNGATINRNAFSIWT